MTHETASDVQASGSLSRRVRYVVESQRSTFTVQAFAGGLLPGLGHNPTIAIHDFAGEAEFSPDGFADASIRVAVSGAGLSVVDDIKPSDKAEIERTMRDDVLEIARFPEIGFKSASVTVNRVAEGRYKARIIGDVTLHGVTRSGNWIQAAIRPDGDEIRASGDFTLRQTDFGIKLVSVAGGVLKLKDELKFTFDIVALAKPGDV